MRLGFIGAEVVGGLRRNLSMAVSVVIVTMISMYLLGLGLMGQRQVDTMKDYWYDKVEVTVLLCPEKPNLYPACDGAGVTAQQRSQVKEALEQVPAVEKVFYESRDAAFTRFKKQYANSPLSQSGPSYFGDTYQVKLRDPTKFEAVSSAITGMPGVAKVTDQKKLLESFFTFLGGVSWAAIALAALMAVCAVLLISTTIRQIAFSRRRETGIMRLVGASNLTIRLPFVMETVIASVLGAALGMVMLWATVEYGITRYLAKSMRETSFIGASDVIAVAPWVVLGVAVLAALTSWAALRRYLRV